jgi:LysR family hydrogen peroxide-inducible transcriptional activator
MEIHQLEYLVALAEEGSFTRAAERMFVAQPSLSQQIQKLEREIGQPLFDRLPRGVVPTEAGQRLIEHARKILTELREAKSRASELKNQVAGTLTIGAIPTIAPFLLPRLAKEFTRRWPEVSLDIVEDVTARLMQRIEEGSVDVALTSSADAPGSVLLETLSHESLLALLPAQHPLASKETVQWSAMRDERFLVLHEMHCLSGQVMMFCRPHGVKPRVVAHGAQLATIAGLVSAGLGISVVPEMMQKSDKEKSRRYKPFAEEPPSRPLCLAWSTYRYRTNAAREFAKVVREALS